MVPTKEKVVEILKKINHPGSGKDIVTLSMVKGLEVEEKNIKFSLDTGGKRDPFVKAVRIACEKALRSVFGEGPGLEIDVVMDAPRQKTPPPVLAGVKNVVAVASGKGGVGKSTVAVNLAIALAQKGYKVGLLDADIFGPSVPKMLGAGDVRPGVKKEGDRSVIIPEEKYGVKYLSVGLFVPADNALIWRGPMATGALKQLIGDADWGELDYMIFDLPPGTSDIHLTLVQELPVTGALIVSTPQDVALADVTKGVAMFRSEDIAVPVLGLVENMAWFTPAELPGNRYYIFGRDGCKKLAEKLDLPVLAQIPLVQGISEGGDRGRPVALEGDETSTAFSLLAEKVVEAVDLRNRTMEPTKKVEIKRKK